MIIEHHGGHDGRGFGSWLSLAIDLSNLERYHLVYWPKISLALRPLAVLGRYRRPACQEG